MNKNLKIIIGIIVIVIFVLGIIVCKNKFSAANDIEYIIVYYDDKIPGSVSDIKITKSKVQIITTTSCSAVNCDIKPQKETFNYSSENIEKLITFINDNFSSNKVEIYEGQLTSSQNEVIQGILLGERFFEINLKKYNSKVETEKNQKLAFTISYNGINCPTPILYLYDDNTYKYYYKLGIGSDVNIPKIGIYNYEINKIIDNIDKYEENAAGPYYIKDANGQTYVTYDTNVELQEFLKSVNIELAKCLE